MKNLAAAAFLFVFCIRPSGSSAQEPFSGSYLFEGHTCASENSAPTVDSGDVFFSNIIRTNVNCTGRDADAYATSGWPATLLDAPARHIGFIISPMDGADQLAFDPDDTLSIVARHSTNLVFQTGPQTMEVRYRAAGTDNQFVPLGSPVTLTSSFQSFSFAFPDVPSTPALEIRIYGYNDASFGEEAMVIDRINVTGSLSQPLSVRLLSFDAVTEGNRIHFRWATESENRSLAFEIEQADGTAYRTIASVPAAGFSAGPSHYAYVTLPQPPGEYRARLSSIDMSGVRQMGPEISIRVEHPERLSISPVYPNPVRETASVTITTDPGEEPQIAVFDILGRRVEAVVLTGASSGAIRRLVLDASGLGGGPYVLVVESMRERRTVPFLVVR